MSDYTFTLGDAAGGADWEAIEDALRQWVLDSSGYAEDSVVWTDQGINRPDAPMIALTLGDLVQLGLDSVSYETDVGGDPGLETTTTVAGPRVCTLRVQHYGGEATGNDSSRAVLARALTALSLPVVRDSLTAAGVGIIAAGPVRNIAGVQALQIEARAVLEVRFSVQDVATSLGTYVETADVTATVA